MAEDWSFTETPAAGFWVSAGVCCAQIRQLLADFMYRVVQRVTGDTLETDEVLNERAKLTEHRCYQLAVNHYKHKCFNWHQQEVNVNFTPTP